MTEEAAEGTEVFSLEKRNLRAVFSNLKEDKNKAKPDSA